TIVPSVKLMDPEKPYGAEFKLKYFRNKGFKTLFLILLAMLILYVLWPFTPLKAWANPHSLADSARMLAEKPLGPIYMIGGYFILATLMVSVNILAVALALVLDPVHAFLYSLVGAVLSSIVIFLIGRRVGTKPLGSIHSEKVDIIREYVCRR